VEIDAVAILVAIAGQVAWLKWELRRLKTAIATLPCMMDKPEGKRKIIALACGAVEGGGEDGGDS